MPGTGQVRSGVLAESTGGYSKLAGPTAIISIHSHVQQASGRCVLIVGNLIILTFALLAVCCNFVPCRRRPFTQPAGIRHGAKARDWGAGSVFISVAVWRADSLKSADDVEPVVSYSCGFLLATVK